mgnify:FL=1
MVFRFKQHIAPAPFEAPRGVRWNYDRAELWADGVVHALGVTSGTIAAAVLFTLARLFATPPEIAAVSIYVAGLVLMLAISATYNLWPVSRWKWWLRRLDHSAIYLLIAATYTPFIIQMGRSVIALALLGGVWSVAVIGIILKLLFPGRFDRFAIVLYLAMGWSGVMVYDTIASVLPDSVLALIAAGGILYSGGVVFHVWERLRFQNAIWHSFVLLGAGCHYSAVLDLVLN